MTGKDKKKKIRDLNRISDYLLQNPGQFPAGCRAADENYPGCAGVKASAHPNRT